MQYFNISVICGEFGRGPTWHIHNFATLKLAYYTFGTNIEFHWASQLLSRVRPFILTYMGTTLSWKSSVSWLREIFSFWNWTTGSRTSSRMNINWLGMNHLISQEWNTIESHNLHRFVRFNETHYCGWFHVVGWSPRGDTIMFILRIFCYFGRKWTWFH